MKKKQTAYSAIDVCRGSSLGARESVGARKRMLGLGARESVMAQGSEKNVMTRGPTNRTWWKPAAGPAAEQEQPLHAMAHGLPESCLDVAVAFGFLRPAQTRQPGPVPLAPCRPRLVPWIMMHVMWRSAQELSRAPRLSTMTL